jgi:hypothetical protein
MQQQWGNACSQADWSQHTYQQSPPMASPDTWSNYPAAGVQYEMPRVPPMYGIGPGMVEQGYQHQGINPEGYTWGKNLLDASNYINHFGNHATTVARRNERERNRVRHINSTFDNLRQHLPCSTKKKKLSKVDTLRTAIKYINHLQNILGKDMKPLAQHIKQENPTLTSCSSSSSSSSSSKRQSLDSSTASTRSVEDALGQEEREEEEDEARSERSSSPESLATDQAPVTTFLADAAHQFQWTS